VFRTTSALEASAGLAVRVGVPVTAVVAVETTLSLNRTRFSTTVSRDIEGARDVTASEPVTQYVIEGGVLVAPAAWRSGRLEPFMTGGLGYLRQLNEGQTLVDTGSTVYGGGGMHYWLKRGGTGRIRSSGVRVDVRALLLGGGVAPGEGRHVIPTVGAAVFVRF
jgi:hypothetical protein